MPQIAQQDYKIIKPTLGRAVVADAAALAELKKAFLNGTIYDCIIESPIAQDSGDGRVLGTLGPNPTIYVTDPDDSGNPGTINFPFTIPQYQGLAAVQAEVDRIDGAVHTLLPIFGAISNGLSEIGAGYDVCTPEGYRYKVTLADGKIATIEASTAKTEGDFIAISIEDAQKLIGLLCSTD